MVWIREHTTAWRTALLAPLLAAMLGPWFFDLIVVPSEYTCSAPFVRLEGDYCGQPLPVIWLLLGMAGASISTAIGLVTGATDPAVFRAEFLRSSLASLFMILLVLPFLSTLFLILSGNRTFARVIHAAAWILAVGAGLVFVFSRLPWLYWELWGPLLYVGLALSALVLELFARLAGRRPRMVE